MTCASTVPRCLASKTGSGRRNGRTTIPPSPRVRAHPVTIMCTDADLGTHLAAGIADERAGPCRAGGAARGMRRPVSGAAGCGVVPERGGIAGYPPVWRWPWPRGARRLGMARRRSGPPRGGAEAGHGPAPPRGTTGAGAVPALLTRWRGFGDLLNVPSPQPHPWPIAGDHTCIWAIAGLGDRLESAGLCSPGSTRRAAAGQDKYPNSRTRISMARSACRWRSRWTCPHTASRTRSQRSARSTGRHRRGT